MAWEATKKRRVFVKKLRSLGLYVQEIADLLVTNAPVVNADIHIHFKGENILVPVRSEVFSCVINELARLEFSEIEEDKEIKTLLRKWLGMADFEQRFLGACEMLKFLCVNEYQDQTDSGYVKLLLAIYGEKGTGHRLAVDSNDLEFYLHQYFHRINENTIPAPKDSHEFFQSMITQRLWRSRYFVLPGFSGQMKELVDLILTDLPLRQRRMLIMRFGLNDTPKTLEEVGDEFDLTRERVRQLVDLAIERLRHPKYLILFKLIDPMQPTFDQMVKEHIDIWRNKVEKLDVEPESEGISVPISLPPVPKMEIYSAEVLSNLLKDIDREILSVRLNGALRRKFGYRAIKLGEIVRFSKDNFKMKNCARGTIRELEIELEKHGLHFGMLLPDNWEEEAKRILNVK